MSYQSNIPQPTDQISQSQSDILGNFSAIKTLIDVDHVDFANSNQGQHNQVTFPLWTATAAPAIGSVLLNNLLNATTGLDELNLTNSAGKQYPITATTTTTSSGITGTWSYLTSGILLKWGQYIQSATGTTVVNTNLFGPAYTSIMNVQLSVRSSSAQSAYLIAIPLPTAVTITATAPVGGTAVYWFTIGI